MRKKLDTRFPAARIKKIMQADEDVGKIALAVPVLVSKALELFLQDLCHRTYNVTLQRGMKTISSSHLGNLTDSRDNLEYLKNRGAFLQFRKQCVHGFTHYDFLRDIVSKVPDMGNNDALPAGEDNSKPTRRRKAAEDEESEEDSKRAKFDTTTLYRSTCNTTNPIAHITINTGTNTNTGTGIHTGIPRGRGRPRGSGKGKRNTARPTEDDPDEPGPPPPPPLRDFDLNLDVNENIPPPSPTMDATENVPASPPVAPAVAPAPVAPAVGPAPGPPAGARVAAQGVTEMKQHEEYLGWGVAMDPVYLGVVHQKVDEEEEDYDEED